MINSLEINNLNHIKNLNQRGGRTLSIIDLLESGTINQQIAGFLFYSMFKKLSFITAANPSGTGKTTLMGTILNLLKPGIRIETLERNFSVSQGQDNKCYLVHELGDGPYYSYLWGKDVSQFFRLGKKGIIASCIHADTLPELKRILFSPSLSVPEKELYNIDLIIFMRKEGGFFNSRRRVNKIYGFIPEQNEYQVLFKWDSSEDSFKKMDLACFLKNIDGKNNMDKIKRCSIFTEKLLQNKIKRLEDVREEVLKFCQTL